MRSALTFARFDLLTRLRGRRAPVAALLALGALLGALAAGGGDGSALAVSWFPWVLGALAFGLAAASADTLPTDRVEGRSTWVATLAPRPASRRAGAALAGAALAVGGTTAASLLVGLLAPPLGAAPSVREARELELPERRRFRDPALGPQAHPLLLNLGAEGAREPRTLEVDLRPILLSSGEGLPDLVEFEWAAGEERGRLVLPLRGRLRLDLPPAARHLELRCENPSVDYALRQAWVLSGRRSFALSLGLTGLLLGLAGATFAPLAVAISRLTSAPTAAATCVAVLGVAGMRAVLPDLSGLPVQGALQHAAHAIVTGAVALAPDLSALTWSAEPSSGRAVGLDALGALRPLLGHALAFTLLALWPGRSTPPSEQGA